MRSIDCCTPSHPDRLHYKNINPVWSQMRKQARLWARLEYFQLDGLLVDGAMIGPARIAHLWRPSPSKIVALCPSPRPPVKPPTSRIRTDDRLREIGK